PGSPARRGRRASGRGRQGRSSSSSSQARRSGAESARVIAVRTAAGYRNRATDCREPPAPFSCPFGVTRRANPEAPLMVVLQQLSVSAARNLLEGFCSSIGSQAGPAAAEAATKFLGARFIDHSARLGEALTRANAGAWRALELALAGDSWWDRIKVTLARREDQAFREQVGAFLRTTPLANLPGPPPGFRQQALRDLRPAQKAGLLTAGAIGPQELAQRAGPFARFADPQALLDAEWQAL